MFRFAALLAVAAVVFVPTAGAAITCQTDAAAEIAGAAVNGPRAGWDPPVWTFDMPDLHASVDVQAYDQPTASAKARAWLDSQVSAACGTVNPAPADATASTTSAPTASAPTVEQTSAAQTIVATATVTYVGNSWGPTPLWRVDLPTLSLSIDVAANSADEARANVMALVVARLMHATSTPVAAPSATAATTAPPAATVSAPAVAAVAVTSEGVTTTPVEVERLLTPTLDPGIRAALLSTNP